MIDDFVSHMLALAVISGNDPHHGPGRLSNLGPDECQAVRVALRQALVRPQAHGLRQPPANPGSLPHMAPGHWHLRPTRGGTGWARQGHARQCYVALRYARLADPHGFLLCAASHSGLLLSEARETSAATDHKTTGPQESQARLGLL